MTTLRNRHRPWLSLRLRVILVTIGLQVIFIATFGGIQVYNEYRSMRDFVRDSSETFARCIAHSSERAIASANSMTLGGAVAMAQQQHGEDVNYVLVQDAEGRVLASTVPALVGTALADPLSRQALRSESLIVQEPSKAEAFQDLYRQSAYDVAVPIVQRGSRIATVRLGISSRGIRKRVWSVVSRGSWMAALALLLGGALAVAVDRKMQRSFRDLINVTRSIAAGDLSRRVTIETGDELEKLGRTFNDMTEQLAASRDELRRWGGDLEEKIQRRTRELEEERQKLEGVVSGIGAGLLLLDRDLRVQWANNVACAWLGPLPELVGQTCFNSARRKNGRCRDCAAARVLASGQVEQGETVSETPQGQRRFFHVTASPIRDPEGRVIQVVELLQDVTEKRQMERQLLQASKLAAIGELAAAVAHEINNPLAVIGASVERVQRLVAETTPDEQSGKVSAHLETVERHVYRCKGTIDKLLGFARNREPRLQPTDLNQVLLEAVGLIGARAAFEGVTVVTDLAPGLPAVPSDPDGLMQVFVNLLTNALDACAGSGEIEISSRKEDGRIVARVSDTGCGIPPERIDAIFEPFFTTKPDGRGTGLGLPICVRILTRLGGSVKVTSRPGAGATFTVTLPLPMPPKSTPA